MGDKKTCMFEKTEKKAVGGSWQLYKEKARSVPKVKGDTDDSRVRRPRHKGGENPGHLNRVRAKIQERNRGKRVIKDTKKMKNRVKKR